MMPPMGGPGGNNGPAGPTGSPVAFVQKGPWHGKG
jgi:hypothetical protein